MIIEVSNSIKYYSVLMCWVADGSMVRHRGIDISGAVYHLYIFGKFCSVLCCFCRCILYMHFFKESLIGVLYLYIYFCMIYNVSSAAVIVWLPCLCLMLRPALFVFFNKNLSKPFCTSWDRQVATQDEMYPLRNLEILRHAHFGTSYYWNHMDVT